MGGFFGWLGFSILLTLWFACPLVIVFGWWWA